MNRENRELRRNGEGYLDLTAYYAIKRADADKEERTLEKKKANRGFVGPYETGKAMPLKQYKKWKLKILDELFVKYTDEEKAHLESLTSEMEVDRYAHKLIMRGE